MLTLIPNSPRKAFGRGGSLIAAAAALWLALAPPVSAATPATTQPSYASPEQAMDALVAAVKSGDSKQIEKILGPGSKNLVSSGDAVADANARDRFLAAYAEGSKTAKKDDTHVVFAIGKDEWPFPIPAVLKNNAWHFDSKAGAEEIIDRRIGENELNTIQVCLAYVDAQRDYASVDRNHDGVLEYAQKFLSSSGKQDGLYWPTDSGQEQSPMGPLVVAAQVQGYKYKEGQRSPYHGYYFRILKAQGPNATAGAIDYVVKGRMIGGFALVAYPAQYGASGVMTFIVNYEGTVYQKNLGKNTTKIAEAMTRYDPDSTWTAVP